MFSFEMDPEIIGYKINLESFSWPLTACQHSRYPAVLKNSQCLSAQREHG